MCCLLLVLSSWCSMLHCISCWFCDREIVLNMSVYHDHVEIEDFEYDEDEDTYYYPCPCGDRFQITKSELAAGEEVATCPSCSLIIKVIYTRSDFVHNEQKSVDKPAVKQIA